MENRNGRVKYSRLLRVVNFFKGQLIFTTTLHVLVHFGAHATLLLHLMKKRGFFYPSHAQVLANDDPGGRHQVQPGKQYGSDPFQTAQIYDFF